MPLVDYDGGPWRCDGLAVTLDNRVVLLWRMIFVLISTIRLSMWLRFGGPVNRLTYTWSSVVDIVS